MKSDVWMPIYVGDYLADTARLTTEQHGAYLLLLMDYWKSGPPPDNDAVLARVTGLSADAWSNARSILQPYFDVADGVWRHKRVDSERQRAVERKSAAVSKAKAAAAAKWRASSNAPSNAPSIPQAMPERCQSQSQSQSEEPNSSPKGEGRRLPCPVEKLVALYHECLPSNPRCLVLSDARRGAIRARWRYWIEAGKYDDEEGGLSWWRKFFEYVAKSAFLTGNAEARPGRAPFLADVEFLFSPRSHAKIIEGAYHEGAQ